MKYPLSAFLLACLFVCAPFADAQYMFLDANGDGRSTSADHLQRLQWADVDLWFVTNTNRDGSPAVRAPGTGGVTSCAVILAAGTDG